MSYGAKSKRRGERGQTILLVAISIVSLLAMAALAIDVVTFYVAKSEAQRAADAAALAGAKAIADSGVTTLQQSDPNFAGAVTLAQAMATAQINALLPVNTVAGKPLLPGSATVTFNFGAQGNPLVTVALPQVGLPTFFARIWGRTGVTVTASATAEAYNPSNTSPYTPIAPMAVKPWLVANMDPINGVPFVGPGNVVETGGGVGEQFDLTADCYLTAGCLHADNPPKSLNPAQVEYMPAAVSLNTGVGPSVCPSLCSGSDYEMSIACADFTTVYSCGSGGATVVSNYNPGGAGGDSATGAECLTRASSYGLGQGQDSLNNPLPFPTTPPQITAGSGLYFGSGGFVSTSSSIVTIPIIDRTATVPPVNIVGFMQAFINGVEPGVSTSGFPVPGDINITVLNIAGCSGSGNGAPAVVGGSGTSPVPVRLITSP